MGTKNKHWVVKDISNMKYPKTEVHKQKLRIAQFEYIKRIGKVNGPNIGRYEKQILDAYQNMLNYTIKRQFYINGYFLDGYCQELNLVFEVDEEYHYKNDILNQKDIDKQNNIMGTLNCDFIRLRVKDIINNLTKDNIQEIETIQLKGGIKI